MTAYFVAGTDTGVGKTLVTAALVTLARSRGLPAVGLKPVAAGAEYLAGQWSNDDALMLQAAGDCALDYGEVNPVLLRAPLAPHLSAELEGRALTLAPLLEHCRSILARPLAPVFIEGAGGLLVPLNPRESLADLPVALALPVILVVGLKLGCLNHAALTAEALAARGLKLAGWVGSAVDPAMAERDANVAWLHRTLPAPCWGIIPPLPSPIAAEAARYLTLPR